MCLADQKIWEAPKHLLEYKIYSQKFWDVKIWDLNRPLKVLGKRQNSQSLISANMSEASWIHG